MSCAARPKSDPPAAGRLHVRVLGPLQLCRGARVLALPPSRKTRALLAYLTVAGGRHRRSALCDLFWEDALDPRAALRWSLTQLRHALGPRDRAVLRADRDAVVLAARPTDLATLALQAGTTRHPGPEDARTVAAALGLFRGVFLDGLELPDCYAFHEWCMARREAAEAQRSGLLALQVEQLRHTPEAALAPARALIARNPLDVEGHLRLIGLLHALGRTADAQAQDHQCCRIHERELGLPPPEALVAARAQWAIPRLRP